MLFRVTPTDTATLAGVAIMLAAVALLAALIPPAARRESIRFRRCDLSMDDRTRRRDRRTRQGRIHPVETSLPELKSWTSGPIWTPPRRGIPVAVEAGQIPGGIAHDALTSPVRSLLRSPSFPSSRHSSFVRLAHKPRHRSFGPPCGPMFEMTRIESPRPRTSPCGPRRRPTLPAIAQLPLGTELDGCRPRGPRQNLDSRPTCRQSRGMDSVQSHSDARPGLAVADVRPDHLGTSGTQG